MRRDEWREPVPGGRRGRRGVHPDSRHTTTVREDAQGVRRVHQPVRDGAIQKAAATRYRDGMSASHDIRPLAVIVRFVRMLVEQLGWRLIPSVVVAVALAFAEGTGLLLLIPLLGSLGLAVDEGPTSRLSRLIGQAFETAGIQPTLAAVLVIFLLVTTAHAVLYRAHLLINPTLEQRFALALRRRLYAAIVSARWSFLVRRRSTELVHAVTTEVDRAGASAYQLLTLMTGCVVTAAYVVLAARMSAALTLLVAGLGLAMLASLRGRTRRSVDLGDSYAAANRRLFGLASESIAGLKVAKSLGAEMRGVRIFEEHATAMARAYLDLLRSFAQGKMRLDLTSAVVVSLLLYLAVDWLGLRGPGLLVLIFILARILPRVLSLQESAQAFVSGLPSFAAVLRTIEACEAETEPALVTGPRPVVSREIRLDGVTFQYAGPSAPAIEEVTLTIPAGLITAIVGPSGAGKSTIADLLLGLLRPARGQLLVDGKPLDDAAIPAWRRSVGYVPQDSFLLHDTVRANLLWARPDATEAQMWDALERAAAADFVRARPEGLDTVVGDRGIQLSGGERQRLALARALLIEPVVLVLDEATSALDSVNEARILSAVHTLRHRITCVIITHRLSTIREADLIHVIEGGRLVESGGWDELASAQGLFATLLRLQAREGSQSDMDPLEDPWRLERTAIQGQ